MTATIGLRRARTTTLGTAAAVVALALLAGCGQQPPASVDPPALAADNLATVAPTGTSSSQAYPVESSTSPTTPPTLSVTALAAPSSTTSPPAPARTSTTTKATPKPTPKPTPKATTTTTPAPAAAPAPPPVTTPNGDPSWRACTTTLAGVSVSVAVGQRSVTIVNGSGGSTASVAYFVRTNTACGFANLFTDTGGRIGYGGLTNGSTRTQGTGTTPLGTYSMTEAFGLRANPGALMTYRTAGAGDFWVEDNNSAYYNSFRNEAQGGFDASLPLSDPNGSERLTDFPGQYDYAIVVNFNRAPDTQVAHRGAGIFIHVRGKGATAGCIAVSAAELVTMLTSMRSGDRVTIVS